MTDLDGNLPSLFSELLRSHGLEPYVHKNWVTVSGNFPGFRGSYYPKSDDRAVAMLHVQVVLAPERWIDDCFAAIGDTDEAALHDAFANFMLSMFHPILAACGERTDEGQVAHAVWRSRGGGLYDAWIGNVVMRLSEGVSATTPPDLVPKLQGAIEKTELSPGYNWISVYYGRLNEMESSSSACLNNSPWDIGLKHLEQAAWPKSEAFYGARLFGILESKDAA